MPAFWLLAASFAICGMTTNGLIGTHFIPAANDHGMPTTVAAGLLATIGILDVAGTVFSGWLTDRVDPRLLLVVYYSGRGISLLLLPSLLSPHAEPSTWVFVIFYGLDWVATVPPTIVLCRNYFGARSPVVFGWVFASHQLGAAIAAAGAGWLRDCRATTTWRSTSPQDSAASPQCLPVVRRPQVAVSASSCTFCPCPGAVLRFDAALRHRGRAPSLTRRDLGRISPTELLVDGRRRPRQQR